MPWQLGSLAPREFFIFDKKRGGGGMSESSGLIILIYLKYLGHCVDILRRYFKFRVVLNLVSKKTEYSLRRYFAGVVPPLSSLRGFFSSRGLAAVPEVSPSVPTSLRRPRGPAVGPEVPSSTTCSLHPQGEQHFSLVRPSSPLLCPAFEPMSLLHSCIVA